MPGIAAQQDHAAGDEPAAQHAVELLDAGGIARVSCASTVASAAPAARAPATLWKRVGARSPRRDSTSVFHASQCGHWPCHLGDWPPHSVQL